MSKWTQSQAIELCRKVEAICPAHGCHVALTGGTLYKDGERKDCDLLFYSVRSCGDIDKDSLFDALGPLLAVQKDHGFCVKALHRGKPVDCFFPEQEKKSGQYDKKPERDPDLARDEAIEDRRLDEIFGVVEHDGL